MCSVRLRLRLRWGGDVVRAKLACASAIIISGRGMTTAVNDNSLGIFTAPTVITLVRGTTVDTITSRLPRNSAAMKTVVGAARVGPSTIKSAISTATMLGRIRNEGLAFRIQTRSDGNIVKRNARMHCVISGRGFVDGLSWWLFRVVPRLETSLLL